MAFKENDLAAVSTWRSHWITDCQRELRGCWRCRITSLISCTLSQGSLLYPLSGEGTEGAPLIWCYIVVVLMLLQKNIILRYWLAEIKIKYPNDIWHMTLQLPLMFSYGDKVAVLCCCSDGENQLDTIRYSAVIAVSSWLIHSVV